MLISAEDADFAALLGGKAPRGLQLPDSDIAPPDILQMLLASARNSRQKRRFTTIPRSASWNATASYE